VIDRDTTRYRYSLILARRGGNRYGRTGSVVRDASVRCGPGPDPAPPDRLLGYVDGKLPEVRDHLDTARADILAFTEFPEY